MSDPCCLYTENELKKLKKEGALKLLRQAILKEIKASQEISIIIAADRKVKKIIKEKLKKKFDELSGA